MSDEVRKVLVVLLQGVNCQELPQDLVRVGPAHSATVDQKEQVPLGLGVNLQEVQDLQPLVQGLPVVATLQDLPLLGEDLLQGLLVVVLPVVSVLIMPLEQAAQGGVPDNMSFILVRFTRSLTRTWW